MHKNVVCHLLVLFDFFSKYDIPTFYVLFLSQLFSIFKMYILFCYFWLFILLYYKLKRHTEKLILYKKKNVSRHKLTNTILILTH